MLAALRGRLRPAKRAAADVIGRIWTLGISGTAFMLSPRAARWSSTGAKRVLVVAPHPDDEAMGCGGTMLLHAKAGDRVCLAIATDGRGSRSLPDPDEMGRLRHLEAIEAARLMRVDRLEWIGLPEGAWEMKELVARLRTLLEEIEPDILYAPSRVDFHPEHLRVSHALALALAAALAGRDRQLPLRVYQVQVPLSPLLTTLVSDVSGVQRECDAVFRAYASQTGSIQCTHRQRRYSAGWYGIRGPVEAFWEVSAQRYVTLHRDPPDHWPRAFRGLRPFPLTDPLAYLAGRGERRRLSRS